MIDTKKIPSGLSWGVRGLRVGKSSYGNWWLSFGLPFGFRYTWMLGKDPFSSKPKVEEIPLQSEANEVIESPPRNQLEAHNKEILKKMKG